MQYDERLLISFYQRFEDETVSTLRIFYDKNGVTFEVVDRNRYHSSFTTSVREVTNLWNALRQAIV